ncbi:beta-defensin 104 [Choloepus didactylus]|uniref:beta-defensin 104 n=1 Tax=Choloepus didactylus TaxID=27675 RepID=UPI00189E3C2C|nr:beta-defensin 104 [Choloepus didactylus]
MRILFLLLIIFLLLYQDSSVRSFFDGDKICGYGTARCRKKCKKEEHRIGRCPNTYSCCLKTWNVHVLNPFVKSQCHRALGS